MLRPFQLFKYLVYGLLIRNIWLFYTEEQAAMVIRYADGYPWYEAITAYSATIDTFFWVILLLLFELETWIIPDHRLTNRVKVSFTTLRAICYTSIVYACYGYVVTLAGLENWQTIGATSSDLCSLAGQNFMYSIDRFMAITRENCSILAGGGELMGNGDAMITDSHHYRLSWMLALADVINASAWLLVVLILEIEIWLHARKQWSRWTSGLIAAAKIVLYFLLGLVAVFWGIYGEFIDFWDAFLWIIAFIFIENNILQWTTGSRRKPHPIG